MTIKEAIYERHTVRKYTGKAIPAETVALLNSRVAENNSKFNLAIKLVTGNSEGIMAAAKLLLGQGVNNYFILAGEDTPGLDEKLGYCGADLILYAQTLGLNTWWIGGMFSRKGAEKNLGGKNLRINGVIAVGYGETHGVQHKSKRPEEISSYAGEEPEWFKAFREQQEARFAALEGEKTTSGRKAKLEALLKDAGTFGTRTLKSFAKMSFESDDDFDEFYSEVEEDLKALNQERANAGLAALGNPPATDGNKPKEDEVISDAEIEALANSF